MGKKQLMKRVEILLRKFICINALKCSNILHRIRIKPIDILAFNFPIILTVTKKTKEKTINNLKELTDWTLTTTTCKNILHLYSMLLL